MRRNIALGLLTIAIVGLGIPLLINNVLGSGCQDTGNQCYLLAQTTVPSNDGTIHVTIDGNPSLIALPHTFSFGNGTTHTISIVENSIKGASGTRYVFHQWAQCGSQWSSGLSPTMTTPLMMANYTGSCPFLGPFIAQFDVYPPVGCISNCLLDATTTVTNNDATVWVRVNTTSTSNFYRLPLSPTLSFPNGTTITIQMMNLTLTGSSGARYNWTRWSQGTNTFSSPLITVQMIANYSNSGVGSFSAQFDKQYKISIKFTDNSNQPVNPPTSLTISSNTGTFTLTSYSNIWLDAVVWTTTDATWNDITGSVGPQTVDLSGAALNIATIQLRAYPETIRIVDRGNNPIVGAQLTVIFSNSTSKQFATDSQGNVLLGAVPAGSYTTTVTYQGQNMGRWTADASQTSTNTIHLPVGSDPSQQQVSAIVLVAIFGLAFVLIFVAMKIRKAPTAPVIGKYDPEPSESTEN